MSAIASASTPPRTPRRRTHHGSPSSAVPLPRKPFSPANNRANHDHPANPDTPTSAAAFQERHKTYFAHLHEHADAAVREAKLRAERERLEEERRAGREKRRTMTIAQSMAGMGHVREGGSARREQEERGGRRPLSLVAKREQGGQAGHARSASQNTASTSTASVITPLRIRRASYDASQSGGKHLGALPSRTQYRSVSDNPAALTARRKLEAVIERSPSPPRASLDVNIIDSASTADTSHAKSTYSWATEFSGETAELRATARYLTKSDEPGSASGEAVEGMEEVLDSPERLQRRRKRIVALAHTVRQLEGVGSRDVEDPAFYQVLVKAWHGRPGYETKLEGGLETADHALTDAPPPLLSPPNILSRSPLELPAASPFPDHAPPYQYQFGRYSAYAIGQNGESSAMPYYHFSPADQQIATPALGSSAFPYPYQYPYPAQYPSAYPTQRPESSIAARRSASSRYSYASTLHDLAMEGGMARGAMLMSEKAWLKSPAMGEGFGENFGGRPPSTFFPQGSYRPPSIPFPYDSPDPQITPERPLRKYRGNIARPAADGSDAPAYQSHPDALPADQGMADQAHPGAGWGLGFVSAWWGQPALNPEAATVGPEQDFRKGEEAIQAETTKAWSLSGAEHEGVDESLSAAAGVEPSRAGQTALQVEVVDSDGPWRLHGIKSESGVAPTASPCSSRYRPRSCSIRSTTSSPPSPRSPLSPAEISTQINDNGHDYEHGSNVQSLVPTRRQSLPPRLASASSDTSGTCSSRSGGYRLPRRMAVSMISRKATTAMATTLNPIGRTSKSMSESLQTSQSHPPIAISAEAEADEAKADARRRTTIGSARPARRSSSPRRSFDRWSCPPCLPAGVAAQRDERDELGVSQEVQTAMVESGLLPAEEVLENPGYPMEKDGGVAVEKGSWEPLTAELGRATAEHRSARPAQLIATALKPARQAGEIGSAFAPVRQPYTIDTALVRPAQPIHLLNAAPTGKSPGAVDRNDVDLLYRPSPTTRVLFFLGFLLPLLWVFAGWPLSKRSGTSDIERGAAQHDVGASQVATRRGGGTWWSRWISHPDPWAQRSRVAASVTLPLVVVGGLTAAVVLAVMR